MFLTKTVGFLPVWGWMAGAGGGYAIYRWRANTYKPGKRKSDGQNSPGGQNVSYMDAYNASSALIENQNLGFDTVRFGDAYGPGVSYIDPSFFGDGPLSLWAAGPMEYSDVFGGFGRDRRDGRGHRRDRGRRMFGARGGGRDLFDPPPGGGGFGYHHSRGPSFPPVPVGGEGFENGGQNVAAFGGHRARGAGMPWDQQSTMGTSGNSYLIQRGDTLNGIAAKLWGQGSSYQGLAQANAGILNGKGPNDSLAAGLTITIPGAPSSGPPAPGGPAGNGVGGGSVGANGTNYGTGGAPVGDYPGANTSGAGASGGGSPSAGQSWSNSSRVKSGNVATNYATGQGQSGVRTSNKQKPTTQAPARNRPGTGRRK